MSPARSAFPRAPPRSIRPRRSPASPLRWRIGAIAEELSQTAADWHARLPQASAGERAAFVAWRAANPAHGAAYDRVQAALEGAQALAEEGPLLALRQQTLARTMLAGRSRRPRWGMMAAGALVLVGAPLAAFGIRAWTTPAPQVVTRTFRTGIGQQADVTLPDGSMVTLDTDSALTVWYGGTARAASLSGQGWFRIRPDDAPFRISAGGRDFATRAGTFDVRTDPGRVRAFANTGQLTLESDDSAVALAPGKLLAVQGSDVVIRTLDDPVAFTGWRSGHLQFADTPLSEAVGEFNRYRTHPIRLADDRAGALRISGAFRTTGASAFVGALATGFPVRVEQDARDGIVISAR
ncbi:FecR domain-containing protein [Sphingomonas sp. GC_Shp_3]|uniref:FecR family protein n=1 Tax=Sphingomonas sp. GC_Shp_3 TaxID=2937383 RepID=UPI00226ADA73|nr:FecR domain-containing protein [Sphingomonas sp. GC_Shp_3]